MWWAHWCIFALDLKLKLIPTALCKPQDPNFWYQAYVLDKHFWCYISTGIVPLSPSTNKFSFASKWCLLRIFKFISQFKYHLWKLASWPATLALHPVHIRGFFKSRICETLGCMGLFLWVTIETSNMKKKYNSSKAIKRKQKFQKLDTKMIV